MLDHPGSPGSYNAAVKKSCPDLADPSEACSESRFSRRESLLLAAAGACYLTSPALAAEEPPAARRPRKGDQLVFADGERAGQPVRPENVPYGGALPAFPKDPASEIVRDASRLNRVLLLRIEESEISARTAEGAVSGVLAFSSVCTHTGCNIDTRTSESGHLVCPCHGSEFDPKDRAKVMNGPAPRRLAQLPLKLVDGVLTVRRGFSGRVGFSAV